MSDLKRYFGDLWDAADATEKLYLTHDLKEYATVFDVGGCAGDWSSEIARRHPTANLYIFEPLSDFFTSTKRRFAMRPKARAFHFGLASRDDDLPLAKNGAASSLYQFPLSAEFEMCRFRDVAAASMDVLRVQNVGDIWIDLMAINIEGGEYDLLRRMIAAGMMPQVREIMVQFHMLWPDCYDQWKAIRKEILLTHDVVWDFPFNWELYRRRP